MDAAALLTVLRDLHPAAGVLRVAITPLAPSTPRRAVTITCLRPGVLIGKDGAAHNELLVVLQPRVGDVDVVIEEVQQSELEPQAIVDDILHRIHGAVDAVEATATAERLAPMRCALAVGVGAIAAHVIVEGATISEGKGVEGGGIDDVGAGEIVVATSDGTDAAGAVVTCTARVQRART